MSGPENKKPQIPNKPNTSNFVIIIIATLAFFAIFLLMSESPSKVKEIPYTEFLSYVDGIYALQKESNIVKARLIKEDEQFKTFMNIENRETIQVRNNNPEVKILPVKKIKEVVFKGSKRIEGEILENSFTGNLNDVKGSMVKFVTFVPLSDPFLLKKLEERDVSVIAKTEESGSTFWSIIYSAIPYLLLFGLIWFFFFRQVQGGNNKAFNFVKSRAKLYKGNLKKIVFQDVAGVDEAKQELTEIVEFLKEPDKFIKMGARIPKGVLLVGPPGTGKTLLAKAVAGEANRPFYSISGSEFVEMFVGVGASRVRDLFETAKKDAPCIVFIDELDAVGRMRGAGLGGGNDEREQTLNQILVEMDGFDNKETIIIIAATNRPDILDPALLRPGRFDRQIVVDQPDLKGRTEILKIHVKTKPISENVNLETVAKGTPGFSGADLENMVNEATLLAARKNKKIIEMEDFEEARDKIMMGPERKSRVILEKEKQNTAYHEAGHTLVAHFLPEADPIHKVTIIPRGRALGVTQHLPTQDRFTHTKSFLLTQIAILLGGRVTEEYKFGKDSITTGASNDIERSTALARSIVCKWGMSDKMGPLTYGKDDSPIFIGKELARYKDYSEQTANEIDEEVRRLVHNQYQLAQKIVEHNKEKLEQLVNALLDKETLQQSEIEEILGPKPQKA